MNPTDSILRDGKILSQEETVIAKELVDDGLCSINESTYLKCVYREDDDFFNVISEDCPGEIPVTEGEHRYTCPKCQRTIYREDKMEFNRQSIEINISGILDFINNMIDSPSIRVISRSLNGKKWHIYNVRPILYVEIDGTRITLPLIHEIYQENVVEWMCISPDNVVPVLVGESTSLDVRFNELNINCYSVGELYDMSEDQSKSEFTSALLDAASRDRLWNVTHRAELSHERSNDIPTLSQMNSRDFEFVSQNLLQFTIGSSTLLGATEPGSGYPDGVFSLHWKDESVLFMWDAKFVRDYTEGKETTLDGEYDKIYRHLSHLRDNQQVRDEFGGVTGIVLISPGIKPVHISRLGEFIDEQQESGDRKWDGFIILFTLDALNELYEREVHNSANFHNKPNNFMRGLNTLLTNQARHADDPEEIRSSDHKCIKVSKSDMEKLFDEYLVSQPVEKHEFDRDAYTEYMSWIHS